VRLGDIVFSTSMPDNNHQSWSISVRYRLRGLKSDEHLTAQHSLLSDLSQVAATKTSIIARGKLYVIYGPEVVRVDAVQHGVRHGTDVRRASPVDVSECHVQTRAAQRHQPTPLHSWHERLGRQPACRPASDSSYRAPASDGHNGTKYTAF